MLGSTDFLIKVYDLKHEIGIILNTSFTQIIINDH